MPPVHLLGAPHSLYTGKARAYLRFKQIPFEETLSTREVYKNTIVPRVGIPIIPVLITDHDQVVQDTTEIIDNLETRYPEPSVYPISPQQKIVSLLFEVYGDEWLVIPAMHYRWNIPENRDYAIQQFGAVLEPLLSQKQQWEIGLQASSTFSGMLPALGITANSAKAIEKSYLQFLSDFDAHLARHAFLLGSRPSIGDYGLIGPLYAHLFLDPGSGEIMKTHAPRVVDWVKRMHNPQKYDGAFLPNDQIPETLLPLLARMFNEQVPALLNTIKHVELWAKANPDNRHIPRGIGNHSFTVEGITESRYINSANQWMWQRPVDAFHALNEEDKAKVRRLLSTIEGASEALDTPINRRIVRKNYRFILADD